ncbi:MAG TPA: amino acid adenylation domain-containing protein, partial [Pyrinomonadaceae bacterium]
MVVALLGILKAGACYLPLDPDHPSDRLSFMLADAGVEVLISEQHLVERLPEVSASLILIDVECEAIEQESRANPLSGVNADNLAYVLYTSGSTGKPKGAMLAHREVVNCVLWMQQVYQLNECDRMLCKTTLNFDPSVWEIFWPLMVGSRIVMATPEAQLDSAALLRTIVNEKVTIAYFVPSMLALFLSEPEVAEASSLRQVICGGESLGIELMRRFYELLPQATLHHSYGPTETAIAAAEIICDRNSARSVMPIGRPPANVKLYVLNEQRQPVPIGVLGELFVGGTGLGRGYLNRPDVTAARFIPDPFSETPGARLYRTGDLVRYLTDGNLQFHGRTDTQVKVRGIRIELGEIEAALMSHEKVHSAVVVARAESLVGYVVTTEGVNLTAAELRQALSQKLPTYMVPANFVFLSELPLMPNGKIDRGALPAPRGQTTDGYAGPRNAIEELIAGVWSDLLGIKTVSIHSDFFVAGGHSLLATQVIARLREIFQVDIPLRSLFEEPTIAGLAKNVSAAIDDGRFVRTYDIHSLSRPELLPLSFAQQRLWFLEQLESAGAAYHIPIIFRLHGLLDMSALQLTINEIVRRHESLRTSFAMVNGEPVQIISSAQPVSLPIIDLSSLPEAQREQEVIYLSNEQAQLKFNLETGPLMHARLVRLCDEEHVLQMTLHHLIADGWSIGVLAREATVLYEAFTQEKPSPLPPLTIQYADFALLQRKWLQDGALEAPLEYWRKQLAGAPEALELPTDYPRPPAQSFHGAQLEISIPETITADLHELSQRENVTLFMTLLAAFTVVLSRYANQSDIVVGTPIANRQHMELENLIGFFVNTLALRINVDPQLTFRDLLRHVREVALGAFTHQDAPFERLIEDLRPHRDLNRNPLFQVTFALQNTPQVELRIPGLTIDVQEFTTNTTRFDLECHLRQVNDELRGLLIYSTDLFERETMERLLSNYESLLESVVSDPDRRVSEFCLDEFPITPDGKIDRRRLPESTQRKPIEQRSETPTAELVADIWSEVLGIDHISADDNFFEIGGHSLLATRVIARLREVFKVEVSLRRLFEMQTLSELAAHIDAQLRVGSESAPAPLTSTSRKGVLPLSFAQERLWFWEQLHPGTPTYNLTSAFRLDGDLNVPVLEQCLNEIMRRHEILRTSYSALEGHPVQIVAPHSFVSLNVTDLSGLSESEQDLEVQELAGEEALRPFDLTKSPLLRVGLLRLGAQTHVALVSMHHIISDGWSMGVLVEEIATLYEEFVNGNPSPLPELPVQYADFAKWQREWLKGDALTDQLEYWKEQLHDAPLLQLRTDRPRPQVYSSKGSILPIDLPPELLRELKLLSRRNNVTLFMTLLAAFNVLLHRHTGQDDIVVGTDIANRTRVETEKLIGFFVNMLVLRTNLKGDPSFTELLRRVREITLGAYTHQDVPFAKLVDEFQIRRELTRNPLFQVVFVLQNAPVKNLELSGLTLTPIDFEVKSAPFDLVFELSETADTLTGFVTHSTELFDKRTVQQLIRHYQNVLEGVVADPDQPLSSLAILHDSEIDSHAVSNFDVKLSRKDLEGVLLELSQASHSQ